VDFAILWLERTLRGNLPPLRRRRFEEALKDLRVARVFARAQARQRQQHSARSRYGVHVRTEARNAYEPQEEAAA
jgi:hypothetical protein